MSPRVVVVGSEGFVGAHVRAAFVARGLEVVGVGRPGSGAEVELDLAEGDVDVAAAVERIGPTSGVVYLAATISRGSSVDARARENLRVIASSAIAWLLATHARWPRAAFVYTSSLKVEGHTDGSPIDPSRPIVRPDAWSYGSAKAFAERALAVVARERGSTLAVVRPTYVYGPGQHAANAIPTFLRALWAGEAPVIFGAGQEVRDDVFAPDVAYVLAEACVRGAAGTFHAASGRAHTLREVAEACCRAVEDLGGPAGLSPRLDPSRPGKPWIDRTFDIGSTARALDYRPTSLEEGLRRQAAWTREELTRTAAVRNVGPEPAGETDASSLEGLARLPGGGVVLPPPRPVEIDPADAGAVRHAIEVQLQSTLRTLEALGRAQVPLVVMISHRDVRGPEGAGDQGSGTFADALALAREDHLRAFGEETGIATRVVHLAPDEGQALGSDEIARAAVRALAGEPPR